MSSSNSRTLISCEERAGPGPHSDTFPICLDPIPRSRPTVLHTACESVCCKECFDDWVRTCRRTRSGRVTCVSCRAVLTSAQDERQRHHHGESQAAGSTVQYRIIPGLSDFTILRTRLVARRVMSSDALSAMGGDVWSSPRQLQLFRRLMEREGVQEFCCFLFQDGFPLILVPEKRSLFSRVQSRLSRREQSSSGRERGRGRG